MSEAKPFAAFDVDGTIFKSSLLSKVIRASRRSGLMSAETFEQADFLWHRWNEENTDDNYQAFIDESVRAFAAEINGKTVEQLQEVTTKMLETESKRMLAFPRLLIETIRDSHYILALSGSPESLVQPFLEKLGFDEVRGTEYQVVGGKFTGANITLGNKVRVIEKLIEEGVVTRLGSIAVGDTLGDIAMLSFAEKPVTINANQSLADQAKRAGWPRVTETKGHIIVSEARRVEGSENYEYVETDLAKFLDSLRS